MEDTEITLHRPNSSEMKTILELLVPFFFEQHGCCNWHLRRIQKKELEMRGVGYRAQLQGSKLVFFLAVGKSHQTEVEAPEGITFELPNPTTIC